MRDFIADRLLGISSGLYVASVWCRDAAIKVLLIGKQKVRR
ncbi:hypothetical protein [Agrobacterium tumefaciens]